MIKLRKLYEEVQEEIIDAVDQETTEEVVNAKSLGITDDIGKFFLVTRPTKDSTKEDIMTECDVFTFATKVKGGMAFEDVVGIYKQKSDAGREATQLIKDFKSELNELENEMTEYRKNKTDLDTKRKAAIERINKMKGAK